MGDAGHSTDPVQPEVKRFIERAVALAEGDPDAVLVHHWLQVALRDHEALLRERFDTGPSGDYHRDGVRYVVAHPPGGASAHLLPVTELLEKARARDPLPGHSLTVRTVLRRVVLDWNRHVWALREALKWQGDPEQGPWWKRKGNLGEGPEWRPELCARGNDALKRAELTVRLHDAVRDGTLDDVRGALDDGAETDALMGVRPRTAVYAAISNRRYDVMALLLRHGADVSARSGNGPEDRLLSFALQGGSDVVRSLLNAGAQLSCSHVAAAAHDGDLDVLSLLLERGGRVNPTTPGATTPLHGAAEGGQAAIVEYLIARGADVNALSARWTTPLHGAAGGGHAAIVEYLIARGADVHASGARGQTPLVCACSGREFDSEDTRDWVRASVRGRFDSAELLLSAGAGVNAANSEGMTPLHGACRAGRADLVKALLDRGANVDARDATGRSPLFVTLARRRSSFGLALASVPSPTPTMIRARSMRAIVDLLLTRDPDVSLATAGGFAPLHQAAATGDLELVETFLARGADPGARTTDGWSAADLAHDHGQRRIVELLRDRGVEADRPLSERDQERDAALWRCARWRSPRGEDCDQFAAWLSERAPRHGAGRRQPSLEALFTRIGSVDAADFENAAGAWLLLHGRLRAVRDAELQESCAAHLRSPYAFGSIDPEAEHRNWVAREYRQAMELFRRQPTDANLTPVIAAFFSRDLPDFNHGEWLDLLFDLEGVQWERRFLDAATLTKIDEIVRRGRGIHKLVAGSVERFADRERVAALLATWIPALEEFRESGRWKDLAWFDFEIACAQLFNSDTFGIRDVRDAVDRLAADT